MTRLLHIVGSPRGSASVSKAVAEAYIAAFRSVSPAHEVDVLDVWHDALPEFDEETMNAKYAALAGLERTDRQKEAWERVVSLAERICSADILIISVPMWNFGIPYKLKMLIDIVSQKDCLFHFDTDGFSGMAQGRAVLVCARGLNYATGSDTPETEFDFQKSYMLMWLRFIGIKLVDTIVVEQSLLGSEETQLLRENAKGEAEALANAHILSARQGISR
ncbi:MAG: NAD(P)H-dependent oxidoreductase [Acetobacter sp.]|nr:NAD(P)H-dependent oxidoreductase [Acetobacter sp.]MCH4060114.1 NAD(P)H-dependent oxidoreductase [Acetobacter sp.]MCH4087054.1 NAD(P)H-dependent oxidoreductase [Acetobacter sp.]MCI1292874.1 NAD(P)H-dependent oxidoreductase [Acetobacter sp.]MCI1319460.1 NAD(P)H-dependent oxidoreductase [Acetobacter sp.]